MKGVLLAILPIPKKGDLRKTDNYRGICVMQVAAKIYNHWLLNQIRPVINAVLCLNQNGFQQGRLTATHILTLLHIVEELQNFKKEVIVKILKAYGIPPEVVAAIKVMYEGISAVVLTPESETNQFVIDTGVLEGHPLAPFLFIICPVYALPIAISDSNGHSNIQTLQ